VDRRGELGEAMMAAGANVDAAAERVGGALMAEAWAEGQSLSHYQGGDGVFFGGCVCRQASTCCCMLRVFRTCVFRAASRAPRFWW
jgi:hypothetical protein